MTPSRKILLADLHIHSCLSPCGRDRMTPQGIVRAAVERGLDLISVTDHNTARMCPVVGKVAREAGLSFLYGLELQTQEDVHLLAYFDDEDLCMTFSEEVYALLPPSTEDPYGLGPQLETDAAGRVIRIESRFLVQGLAIGFRDAVDWIRERGGLPVPAHVDRDLFSVQSQMGGFPPGMSFSMAEVIGARSPSFCGRTPMLRTSDAHDVDQIARRATQFTLGALSLAELHLAARQADGRSMRSKPVAPTGDAGGDGDLAQVPANPRCR